MGTFETFPGAQLEGLRRHAKLLTGDRQDAHDLSVDPPSARRRGRRLIAVVAATAAAVLVAGAISLAHGNSSAGTGTNPAHAVSATPTSV